jgi:hypothetical protein
MLDPGRTASYIIRMENVIPVMLGLAMLATVGVLFAGVISFAVGSKMNQKYATRLMAARVACQAVAIALFGALVVFYIL